jgi:hypothetical protein
MAGEATAQPAPTSDDVWRRTVDGWERSDHWHLDEPAALAIVAPQPHHAPHPALVAALMAIVSAGALVLGEKRPTSCRVPERRRPHWGRQTDRVPANLSP